MRENFTLFKNQVEAIRKSPIEYQAEVFFALADYNLSGKYPTELSPVADAMLQSFSISIEKSLPKIFQQGFFVLPSSFKLS